MTSRVYNLPAVAAERFKSLTGLEPDLLTFLEKYSDLPDNGREILALDEDCGVSSWEFRALQRSLSDIPLLDRMFKCFLEREVFAFPRMKVDIKRYLLNLEGKTKAYGNS